MNRVRSAAVSGTWYPGSAAALRRAVDGHLASAEGATGKITYAPRALIAPHAGLAYSGPVAACAYALVRGHRYRAVVLVGPSHFVGFDGVAIWPRGAWETPLGEVAVDEVLAEAIARRDASIREYPRAHEREHSLEMQLPFVAHVLPGVPIVPMVMGFQHRETVDGLGLALGRAVAMREASGDGPVLLVASSDLSHYLDAPRAARLDAVVARHVEAFDPDGLMEVLEQEPSHACGGGPMVSVMRAAAALGASRAGVLRYADSGDVSGDKSAVVGYLAAAFWQDGRRLSC
ncbi:MAG: AmmeMemoRadiSam system protein B [Acidimicrobiia bacterium]|nr:AmmeMemoRadiSam system protein B [Acidimicrobiia bacterium]